MKKSKFFLCMCAILAFTGCSAPHNDSETKKEEEVTSISQFPETYQYEGENVTFDTQITIDNQGGPDCAYSGKAKLQPIEYMKLKSLIPESEHIKEESKEELNNYFGDKSLSYYCLTDNEERFDAFFHVASYATSFADYVRASFRPLEGDEMYNGNLFSTEKELPDFPRQDAFEQLKDTLKKVNCEIPDEYICYSLDHETMSQEEYWTDMNDNETPEDKKDEWTREDDSYYFGIRQRVCGLPAFHPLYYTEMSDTLESMPVQAIISRRGIEELEVERLFTYEMDETPVKLLSFEEIAKSIEYNLSQVIGMEPFVVTEAKLCYYEQLIGKDEYNVIPVWLISEQQDLDDATFQYLRIYDAVTGKEISI